jgi:hypothetical protein
MAIPTVSTQQAPQVASAIRQAAATTGASFDYLLATAQLESGLNPAAQAPTSSAGGLFQFIDQTWLGIVKTVGPAVGLGSYAEAIQKGADGRYQVADPAARQAILGLRNDPVASATMAGAFTRNNGAQLAQAIGRQPSESELYMAHFLGADGAGKLIKTVSDQPQVAAASLFPGAASANRSIFFDGSRPRTVAEVYGRLDARFQVARTAALAAPAARTPDTAGMTQVLAAAAQAAPSTGDGRPLFQAMFTDRGASPVSPAVGNLWSNGSASNAALDLFTDGSRSGGWRGMFEG